MTIERFVVLVTPIFASLSGWLCEWVGTHFPGTPTLDKAGVTALFLAGVASAVGAVVKWLHERSKHTLKADRDPFPHVEGTPVPPPDEGDAGARGAIISPVPDNG